MIKWHHVHKLYIIRVRIEITRYLQLWDTSCRCDHPVNSAVAREVVSCHPYRHSDQSSRGNAQDAAPETQLYHWLKLNIMDASHHYANMSHAAWPNNTRNDWRCSIVKPIPDFQQVCVNLFAKYSGKWLQLGVVHITVGKRAHNPHMHT